MANKKENETKEQSGKPKAGVGDYAHTLARAGLSTIPVVGRAIKEFFNTLIAPPLQKHLIEWIESLEKEVYRLHDIAEDFRTEDLSKDNVFATNFSYALQIAIRTHQSEKLAALRNAVLNITIPISPDEDQLLIFMSYVDIFTPTHLKILKFFDDPKEWAHQNGIKFPDWTMGTPADALEKAFPELERDFYDPIIKDLSDRGLLNNGIHTGTNGMKMVAGRTTKLGKKFLKFISSPFKIS